MASCAGPASAASTSWSDAPGHILRQREGRIKTDTHDTEWLARLLLAGELRLVHVPAPWQESLRKWCAAARTYAST